MYASSHTTETGCETAHIHNIAKCVLRMSHIPYCSTPPCLQKLSNILFNTHTHLSCQRTGTWARTALHSSHPSPQRWLAALPQSHHSLQLPRPLTHILVLKHLGRRQPQRGLGETGGPHRLLSERGEGVEGFNCLPLKQTYSVHHTQSNMHTHTPHPYAYCDDTNTAHVTTSWNRSQPTIHPLPWDINTARESPHSSC